MGLEIHSGVDPIQNSQPTVRETQPSIDWHVFVPTMALVIVLGVLMIVFKDGATELVNNTRTIVTTNLGWLYLLVGIGALVFGGWLAFGRYGNVVLGVEGEKPEYSNLHWIAMMFTAGIGAGLIVWGFAEPIYYKMTPPFGVEPHSSMAIEWAHAYPLFHWGIIPWAIYAVAAIPIAYILYRRQDPYLRISNTITGAFPGASNPAFSTFVDILIMLGILGGTATSLGLGVPLVSAFLAELFGVTDSIGTKILVLVFYTLLFGASAYRGLKKGIKVLADINMALAAVMMLFILLVGPTLFILSLSVNSVGLLIDEFWRMSFWTDPIDKSGFPEAWTVFYWAWWIAFAAFIGLFFGRISRGRTIRQVIVGVICWGSLGTTLFLMIAGGYSLHLDHTGLFPVSQTLSDHGLSYTVAKVIATLPMGKASLFAFLVLAIIFYATTLDSAAYVLASVCSKDLHNDEEPPKANRLIWAFALAFFTAGLINSGGLAIVQASTILFSVPIIPILILMCISLVKWLNQDIGRA